MKLTKLRFLRRKRGTMTQTPFDQDELQGGQNIQPPGQEEGTPAPAGPTPPPEAGTRVSEQAARQAREDIVTDGIRVLERAENAEAKLQIATEQFAVSLGISFVEASAIIARAAACAGADPPEDDDGDEEPT